MLNLTTHTDLVMIRQLELLFSVLLSMLFVKRFSCNKIMISDLEFSYINVTNVSPSYSNIDSSKDNHQPLLLQLQQNNLLTKRFVAFIWHNFFLLHMVVVLKIWFVNLFGTLSCCLQVFLNIAQYTFGFTTLLASSVINTSSRCFNQ